MTNRELTPNCIQRFQIAYLHSYNMPAKEIQIHSPDPIGNWYIGQVLIFPGVLVIVKLPKYIKLD